MNFTCYSRGTGEFLWVGSVPSFMFDIQTNNEVIALPGIYDSKTQYVNLTSEEVENRPPLPIVVNKTSILANGLDEWIVTGIPEGALVTDPTGVTSTVNDGEIVFSVDIPDTYVFIIKAFPYLDTEISIEATA